MRTNSSLKLRDAAVALSTKDVDFVVLAEWYSKDAVKIYSGA